ncbi:MAG: TonB-dependent receptor [Pseudomonadota bacterium]
MNRFTKSAALGATALAAGLVSTAAYAQTQDVITVTAQKREQTLQETPVSVAVVTDEAIQQSQIRDAADLQTLVPSLRVAEFAASTNTQFTLRGIGTSSFNPGLEPSVGVFVDGVYRPRAGAAINDLLSMERVEVIRGPQSTLFGRNTPAGVVSFITQEPEFDFGGDAEVTIGNFGQLVVKGTVTGPITDTLAFRIDGTSHTNTGYLENVSPSAQVTDINNRDRRNYRGQLLWTPDADTEVRIIADYGDIDENCCAAAFGFYDPIDQAALIGLGGTALPADPFDEQVAIDGLVNTQLETSGISAQIDRDFETFTFTSITAYRRYDELQNIDADFSDLSLVEPRDIDNEYTSFTQEIRFTSTGDNFVDWMGGLFYYDNDLTFDQNIGYGADAKPFFDLASQAAVADIVAGINAAAPGTLPANAGGITLLEFFVGTNNATGVAGVPLLPANGYLPAGLTVQENYQYDTQSWSLFGQFDINFTDRFTLTLGGRYTQEDKDMVTDITITDTISELDFASLGSNLRFINPALCPAFPNGNSCPFLLTSLLAQSAAGDPAFAAQLEGALAASGIPGATLANPFVVFDPNVAAFLANTPFNPLLDFAAFQNFSPVDSSQFPTSRSDDNLSYSIIASYDVSDTLNVYASYSTGFKPGGFNLSYEAVETGVFEFNEEDASSWELGAKGSLLDGAMQFAVAYFNQEIEDFQAENFVGTGFALDNAGSIEVSGIEFDVQWAPTDRLFFTLGGTYLIDDNYGEYEFAPCPDSSPLLGPVYNPADPLFAACATPRTNDRGATGNFNDLSGVDRGNSELVAAWTGTYTQPIGDNLEMFIRGEATHTSEFALVTGLDPRPVANQDAFTLYNASIGIGAEDGAWGLQLWGRNLGEEEFVKGGFPSVGYLGSSFNNYPGEPRTYGLTLRASF